MKRLDDLSVFRGRKASLYSWNLDTGSAFSSSGNAAVKSVSLAEGTGAAMPLFCRYVCESEINGNRVHRRKKQNFISFEFIFRGELYVKSGKTGYIAEEGDLCILKNGFDHEFFHQSDQACSVWGFIIEGRALEEITRLFRLEDVSAIHIKDSRTLLKFRELFASLLKDEQTTENMRRNSALCFELFQFISENYPERSYSKFVRDLIRYLEDHFSEPLNMKETALRFNCSLPLFNKRFSGETGETPYRYLMKYRLSRAAELLRSNLDPVKEISIRVGYSDPLYFSGEFRKIYGVSPTAYRMRYS